MLLTMSALSKDSFIFTVGGGPRDEAGIDHLSKSRVDIAFLLTAQKWETREEKDHVDSIVV